MGNPFSSKQSSTSSYTPFNGEQAGWQKNTWDSLQSKFNNPFQNKYTGANPNEAQTGSQVFNDSITGVKNQLNNQTMNNFANGQYLDVMSNPYMKGYIDQTTGDYSKLLGKAFDNTNSLFQTRGLPGSSAWQNSQKNQTQTIADQLSRYLTSLGTQSYQQNVGNMMSANSQLSGLNSQLGNLKQAANQVDNTNRNQAMSIWQAENAMKQQDTSNLLNMLNMSKNPTQTSETEESGGWGPGLMSMGLGIMAKKNNWYGK